MIRDGLFGPQPIDEPALLLGASELRASCRVRTTTLYERLAAMTTAGLVVKSADGYCLAIR